MSEDRGSCFFFIVVDRERVSFQPEDLGAGWSLPSPWAGDVLAEPAAGRHPGGASALPGWCGRALPRASGMGLWLVLVPPQFQPTGLVAGLSVSKEMMVVSVQGRKPFVDTAGISERGQIVRDGCGGW